MKRLVVIAAVLISINAASQKYQVGLEKVGTTVNPREGIINVTDSTVISIFDGQETSFKITSRNGFTVHVTDGKMTHKYTVSKAAGRMHGFTYEKIIKYEPDRRHAKNQVVTYYAAIQRD